MANLDKYIINRLNDMSVAYIINLEQPYPDVPFAQSFQPTGSPSTIPHYEGGHVEGAIAEALWDIYDDVDDGD
ncbi:MAG: hypothetical protein ABIJ45_06595, partial [Candidatus Zixiibacteriota bacterium]